MTTSATIRDTWATLVWQDADLVAISPNIHDFDIEELADLNAAVEALLMHGQEINFWQYGVSRAVAFGATGGQKLYTFPVVIKYFRDAEEDFTGANYNAVIDAFETLYSTVEANLGATWNNTIEVREWQTGPVLPVKQAIRGRLVWVGQYTVTGQISAAS